MGAQLPGWISTVGGQALGLMTGAIAGGMADKRQFDQAANLQGLQIIGQKHMTDYNMKKQLEMWKATNYKAQIEEMKKAGLNPGMIYGMSGSGGTTSNINTGNVQGQSAASTGGEYSQFAQQGMQLQLLKAQKDNIEADTANKIAENPNVPLKGENIVADTKNKNMDTTKKDQEQYGTGLVNSLMEYLQSTDKGGNNVNINESMAAERYKEETGKILDERTKIGAEIVKYEVENRLNEAKIKLTEAEVNKIAADIIQRAQEIVIKEGHLNVDRLLSGFNTDWTNIIGKQALETIGGIIQLLPLGRILRGSNRPPTIQGFGGKRPY